MRNSSAALHVLRALWHCARRCAGIAALAAAPLLAWHASAPAAEPRTWIVGATVISPERADPGRKLHVLIEGDRIAALAEITKVGRAAGLPVLLHASSLEAQRFGVDGGTDIFAHGLWNWDEFNDAAPLPDALPEPVRALLDQVAERRMGYMPTLQVIGGLRVPMQRRTRSDREHRLMLLDASRATAAQHAAQVFGKTLLSVFQAGSVDFCSV